MTKHKRIKLNMRPSLVDDLIHAYLSGNAPTRASVSESCGVSRASAGKVAKALVESKIMCEKTFSMNGDAPSAHLFVDDDVNVMIIDLSTPRFSLALFDPNAQVKFQATYSYDTSVLFDDNLNIFLSRCGLKAKQSEHPYSAIAVIYADDARRAFLENAEAKSILPSIHNEEKIDRLVFSVFHKHVTKHLTVSMAICESLKFNASSPILDKAGVSYIFLGSRLFSFHVYQNGSITVCSPQNILSDNEKELINKSLSISKDELDALFIRLAIFMDSAFCPAVMLLESDNLLPDDDTAQKLYRAFALKGITPPIIQYKSSDKPLYILGAIKSSLFAIAKKYIIT